MDKKYMELPSWCHELGQYQTPTWSQLPDLDLYMDQVITYLERQTVLFSEGDERLITPAMINNYVKSGMVPRPNQKKYTREHLAYLLAISMLKQVLPIPDIAQLIDNQADQKEMKTLFNTLGTIQDQALQAVSQRVETVDLKDSQSSPEELLGMMALKLTFEANANILAAKKILSIINKQPTPPEAKEKEKEKKKKADPAPKNDRAESASNE